MTIDSIITEIDRLRVDVANAKSTEQAQRMVEQARRIITDRNAGKEVIEYDGTAYSIDKYAKPIKTIATGFRAIDDIARYPVGRITVVAGLTHHGKSVLMRNLVAQYLRTSPGDAVYFAYEDSCYDFFNHLSLLVHNQLFEKERITSFTWEEETKRKDSMYAKRDDKLQADLATRVHVFDKQYDTEYISFVLREILKRYPATRVVFFDYLQLIPHSKGESARYLEVKAIMDDLLTIAKETGDGVAIVVGAQYNQSDKPRKGLENIYNVYEARAINHYTAVWLSIWNDTMYKLQTGDSEVDQTTHDIKISVFKNRHHTRRLVRNLDFGLDKETGEIFYRGGTQ